jgi:Galactose oxidase, central domain
MEGANGTDHGQHRGGIDSTGAMTGTTEWLTTSNAVAGPAITPRMHACALTLGERVLIVGGEDANGLSAAAELIEADGSVTTVSFAGPPRVGHACVVREDGSALIVGGRGAEGALDDLWPFTPP